MTSNLKYALEANKSYVGSYNNGSTFTFNTGATCSNNGACIMNGNTVSVEQVTGGGYYYSWYAATAGKGTSSSTGDINGSICPAGWKLPYDYGYSSARSYSTLVLKYLSAESLAGDVTSTLEGEPLNFLRAGYYNSAAIVSARSLAHYWASTVSISTKYSYNLDYTIYSTYLRSVHDKSFGFSIRCVAI